MVCSYNRTTTRRPGMRRAMRAVKSPLDLIGNTPMLDISVLSAQPDVRIYAKLEWYNPGGSIKDRPARQMILDALTEERLKPGMTVLEATSGNTGTAQAYVCRALGIPYAAVIPAITSSIKRQDMERYGATVHVVAGDTTEPALERAYQMRDREPERYFLTDQYTNPSNPRAHYLTTAPEIARQCPDVSHIIAAQGSFGTLGGIGRWFRERRPAVRLYAVVARPGVTTVFGMKEADYQPPLVDDSLLSGRFMVDGHSACAGIQSGLQLGIQPGPSAGAVLAATVRLSGQAPANSVLVCVLADGGQKYPGNVLYERATVAQLEAGAVDHISFTGW